MSTAGDRVAEKRVGALGLARAVRGDPQRGVGDVGDAGIHVRSIRRQPFMEKRASMSASVRASCSSMRKSLLLPNAEVHLRANQTKCQRSELPKIARLVQRISAAASPWNGCALSTSGEWNAHRCIFVRPILPDPQHDGRGHLISSALQDE